MAPSIDGHVQSLVTSALRFYKRSYAADYIGFVALLLGYLSLVLFATPFHRLFYTNDLALAFPHAEHERVPVWLNFVYALFIPLGVMLLSLLISRGSAHKYHVTILGFAIALILTSFITDTIKNAVGRPRPDLLARCKPAMGTPIDTLVDISVCTETRHHLLQDGWRSFPSGHASMAVAGLGYLSFFLAGQLHLFVVHTGDVGDKSQIYVRGDLGKALLCLAPLLGAAMIAISRCQDYRHDVYDIGVGALIGFAVAHWSYRRHWPGLSSPNCSEPYPEPSAQSNYGRLRDEEQPE